MANFSASATTVAVNTQVNFTDSSSNSPTSWYWDFGDGNISTVQSPSHTYTSGGKYNVALTAAKASGQNTKIVDRYMTIMVAPIADFWARAESGPAPVTTVFLDQSLNFPTSWSWNFGDGNTSTVQNPDARLFKRRNLHRRANGDQCVGQQYRHKELLRDGD